MQHNKKQIQQPHHHMKTYVLNTGLTTRFAPAHGRLTPQEIAILNGVLQREAALLKTPCGDLEYHSRRRGSSLEFAFAKDHVMLAEVAVSREGPNRQTWDEFVARYHELLNLNAVHGRPARHLPAPADGPWFANLLHLGMATLTEYQIKNFAILQLNLAATFIYHPTGIHASRQ